MAKVLEKHKIEGRTILVCEKDKDVKTPERIITNIGIFSKNDFSVSVPFACFSNPTTINVIFKDNLNADDINYIDFE